MKQYEYLTLLASHEVDGDEVETALIGADGLSNPLSSYGAQGWELVCFDYVSLRRDGESTSYKLAVLRREVPTALKIA